MGNQCWMKSVMIQQLMGKEETTYGKGVIVSDLKVNRESWKTVIGCSISLGLADIEFKFRPYNGRIIVSRSLEVSEKGDSFILQPYEQLVPNPCTPLAEKARGKPKRLHVARGYHFMPKIRKMLNDKETWNTTENRRDYMYPGFNGEDILFIGDIQMLPLSSKSPDFLWGDIQLSKGSTHKKKLR